MKAVAWVLLAALLAAPGIARSQTLPVEGAAAIAGGSAVGSQGPLGAMLAPVAGPLLGGLVPLIQLLGSFPCMLCVGAKVQPKEDKDFLQQFHSGVRGFYGFNSELVVTAPFGEQGALTPENTEKVFFLQVGLFDLTINPETNEITAGYITGERSNLPVFDVLPTGPVSKTDFRRKIGDLTQQ